MASREQSDAHVTFGGHTYTIEVDETRRCAGDLMRVAQSLVSVTQALNNTKV